MVGFTKYLSQFRVSKGERCSHLGMAHTKGSYYIPDENKNTFMTKYFEHVFVNSGECDLIERHCDLCCLLYDLDFKIAKDSKDRAYTQDSVNSFIECVTRVTSKYIEASCTAYDAFVCEKATPSEKKDCLKDGLHIMFPYIVTEPAVQHLIREEVLIEAKHIFPDALNTIDDIVDIAVLDRNGWMMYGASKPEGKPYNLTGIWGYTSDENVGRIHPSRTETSPYYTPTQELVNLLSIRRFTMADLATFRPEMQDIVESWIEDFNSARAEKDNVHSRKFHGDLNRGIYVTDLKTIEQLVSILDSKRASEYNSWLELGFCLHNISDTLLESWIEFSERDARYSSTARDECTTRWAQMKNHGLGVGTLHMWAKKDNSKGYFEIMQNDLEYFIVKTVCNTAYEKGAKAKRHASLSDIVYHVVTALKQKYDHFYICSDYDRRTWYEFTGTTWIKDDGDVSLKRKVREELHADFMNVSSKYRRLSERFQSGHPNKEKYDTISSEVCKVAHRLRDASFRKKVLEEAIEQFYWHRERSEMFESNKFEEILDTQTHLIGLKNGVYDLNLGQFRESRCEDYLTLSTDIEYQEFQWTDPIVDDIREFLKQILPDKEVREYVMHVLSSFLDGEVRYEHFHIWIGSGGNGKSKLIELFEYAFGRYCAKLPVAALTGKRASASAPQPEIARLVGKRFVVLQEPNENERIQVGIMKEYTGGDKITVRTLNKEPIEFKPQFKMVLTCNKLPSVPADDGGTWRRIRAVEFKSKFKENPDPDCPNEFPLDHTLGEKLKKWKHAFFWMLTQYHKQYREHGYKEPAEVMAYTTKYQQGQDQYVDFCIENIEKHENGILYVDDIWPLFQYWYKRTVSDRTPPRKELVLYLEKKCGSLITKGKKKGWTGWRLKDDGDDCVDDL